MFDPYDESHPEGALGEFLNSVPVSSVESDLFDKLLPEVKK